MSRQDKYDINMLARIASEHADKPRVLDAFDRVTGGQVSARLTQAGGKREGAGRPTLPEEERCSERVTIRLTQDELDRLMALADTEEKKSALARRLLLLAIECMEKENAA